MRFYLPHCAIEASRKAVRHSESPPPRPSLFASRGTVSAKDGLSLSVAMMSDANDRFGIAAALALQGNVAEERLTGSAPPPYQQRPRDIGNASAFWARRSQVRVALTLGLTD
jgi:hypothetical protein